MAFHTAFDPFDINKIQRILIWHYKEGDEDRAEMLLIYKKKCTMSPEFSFIFYAETLFLSEVVRQISISKIVLLSRQIFSGVCLKFD